MAEQLAEIERIAGRPGARRPSRTRSPRWSAPAARSSASRSVYGIYSSTLSTPEFQAVEQKMAPKLAAFQDRITQNEPLFERIDAVYEARERSGSHARAAAPRLARLHQLRARRREARRGAPKKRLSEINQRLATLFTTFSQNVLADETDYVTLLASDADLAGLPAVAASRPPPPRPRSAGKKGQWAIAQHALEHGAVPHLLRAAATCARRSGARTTAAATTATRRTTRRSSAEILKLRAERAKLLGYATHAHWRIEDQMAHTPERAMELMEAVWKPAVARVREEVADMQALADGERRGDPDRALGLPLLRREGAQGEVRPRRERDQALPAAREAARGHVLGGRASCSAAVRAGHRTCRSRTPTCASTR